MCSNILSFILKAASIVTERIGLMDDRQCIRQFFQDGLRFDDFRDAIVNSCYVIEGLYKPFCMLLGMSAIWYLSALLVELISSFRVVTQYWPSIRPPIHHHSFSLRVSGLRFLFSLKRFSVIHRIANPSVETFCSLLAKSLCDATVSKLKHEWPLSFSVNVEQKQGLCMERK